MPAAVSRGQSRPAAAGVQPTFGGDLFPALRHQGGLIRSESACQRHDLLRRRQFQVQDGARRLGEPHHVVVLDVTPVFPQVHGDTIGTGLLGQAGRLDRIGFVSAPGLTHGRHVVDVDVQPDGRHCSSRGRWFSFAHPQGGAKSGA
jgi:hypothetical protein